MLELRQKNLWALSIQIGYKWKDAIWKKITSPSAVEDNTPDFFHVMMTACKQGQYKELFTYLHEMAAVPESIPKLINLLRMRDENQLHIGIAAERTDDFLYQYISLLKKMFANGASPQEIYSILALQNNNQKLLSHTIMRSQNQEIVIDYGNLLIDLLRSNISVAAINNLLGNNIKTLWMRFLFVLTIEENLTVFKKLYQASVSYEFIFYLLKINAWHYQASIASSKEKAVLIQYFLLLKMLAEEDCQEAVFALMRMKIKLVDAKILKETFIEAVARCQSIDVIYQMIVNGLLPKDQYKNLDHKKNDIMNYILSIKVNDTNFFKKNILRDAFDKQHPLGSFLLSQSNDENKLQVVKEEMKKQLTDLHEKDKLRWKSELFPSAKDSEIDNYLDLNNPYETPELV